jgi:hypothetical protein
MAYLIYQDHTIVSSAVYDEVSGKWKLTAKVTWKENGSPTRRLHFVKSSPEPFSRFEDAEKAGTEAAKNWVDSQLNKSGSGSIPLPFMRPPETTTVRR